MRSLITASRIAVKNPQDYEARSNIMWTATWALSVDVVPDISVRDEAALASQLTDEIKALVPGEDVTILIDHNYSE